MKIAISATGPSLDAEVDPRFGRCQYIIVADPDTMEFEATENANIAAGGGAGISTAQMVANMGVQAVLTGNCGPNAYQALSAGGVQVFTGVSGSVEKAIEGYKAGKFQATSGPNAGPHSGMGRGMGSAVPQVQSAEQELDTLRGQTDMLKQQLNDIQRQIEELGGKSG